MRDLGYSEADVAVVDLSKADEKALNIALNKISGEWDEEKLAAIFAELDADGYDLRLTGFGEDEYSEILSALTESVQAELMGDPDEVPEPPQETVTVLGDIWQLGRHRLMCGDSARVTDVDRLMNGRKVEMSFTSPPYNIGTNAVLNDRTKDNKYESYDDDNDNYSELLDTTTEIAIQNAEFCFVNIQMLAGNKKEFAEWLNTFKEYLCDIAIWYKDNAAPAMARRVMNSSFEFVCIFSKENNSRAIGTKDFRGTVSNVYQSHIQMSNEYSKIHSATFPISFVSHFIEKFTEQSQCVLDLFGGTGTTLIACEQLDRTCYMMELDPKYCDVIVKRYAKVTGKQDITLIRNGEEIPVEVTGILN